MDDKEKKYVSSAMSNRKRNKRECVKTMSKPGNRNSKFEETGCAVCGQLVVMTKLKKLTHIKCSLDPLVCMGVTRLPWKSVDDPIKEIDGPIIDANCKHVCC
jgi:hypothetical protein